MEPSRKSYNEDNFRYACPETQCILTGILVKESDIEPDYNKTKAKWVYHFTRYRENENLHKFCPIYGNVSFFSFLIDGFHESEKT